MALTYQYRVRDSRGKIYKGTVDADTRQEVLRKLQSSGFLVLDLKEYQNLGILGKMGIGVNKIKTKEMAVYCRQLSVMLRAGIPLLKSLDLMEQQLVNPILKKVTHEVKRDIHGGSSFSDAMAKHKIFPNFMSHMVRAGEIGGILENTLLLLANHYDKEYETKKKIQTASAYPLLISVFAAIVVVIMITVVLPTFIAPYEKTGALLPLPTRILLGISNFIKNYYLIILGFMVLAGLSFTELMKKEKFRFYLDSQVLRLPLIKEVSLKLAVFRFSRILGNLIKSGVPIVAALDAVAHTVGNRVVAAGILKAKESLKGGDNISGPLKEMGVFPVMVNQMIAIGEESGQLEEMLQEIGDYSEGEVDYIIESTTKLIEPILIIVVASIIGFIVISMMLPMYGSMKLR